MLNSKIKFGHLCYVGILFGFVAPFFLGPIFYINNISNEKMSALVNTMLALVLIGLFMLIGNFTFKKIISKEATNFSVKGLAIVFFLLVSGYFIITDILPALNALMNCLSSACQNLNPRVKLVPFYLVLDAVRIVIISGLYLYVGGSFFHTEKTL